MNTSWGSPRATGFDSHTQSGSLVRTYNWLTPGSVDVPSSLISALSSAVVSEASARAEDGSRMVFFRNECSHSLNLNVWLITCGCWSIWRRRMAIGFWSSALNQICDLLFGKFTNKHKDKATRRRNFIVIFFIRKIELLPSGWKFCSINLNIFR